MLELYMQSDTFSDQFENGLRVQAFRGLIMNAFPAWQAYTRELDNPLSEGKQTRTLNTEYFFDPVRTWRYLDGQNEGIFWVPGGYLIVSIDTLSLPHTLFRALTWDWEGSNLVNFDALWDVYFSEGFLPIGVTEAESNLAPGGQHPHLSSLSSEETNVDEFVCPKCSYHSKPKTVLMCLRESCLKKIVLWHLATQHLVVPATGIIEQFTSFRRTMAHALRMTNVDHSTATRIFQRLLKTAVQCWHSWMHWTQEKRSSMARDGFHPLCMTHPLLVEGWDGNLARIPSVNRMDRPLGPFRKEVYRILYDLFHEPGMFDRFQVDKIDNAWFQKYSYIQNTVYDQVFHLTDHRELVANSWVWDRMPHECEECLEWPVSLHGEQRTLRQLAEVVRDLKSALVGSSEIIDPSFRRKRRLFPQDKCEGQKWCETCQKDIECTFPWKHVCPQECGCYLHTNMDRSAITKHLGTLWDLRDSLPPELAKFYLDRSRLSRRDGCYSWHVS